MYNFPFLNSNENGKKYVMRQLWFKRVKEENINCSYKCIFSENGFEKQTFILQKGIVQFNLV